MAKKQKRPTPKPAPTKRQLSKWQRQERIRRIIIIAAAVFVAGVLTLAGLSLYQRGAPWREVVIKVNGVPVTMEYYVNMFDGYTAGMDEYELYYMGEMLANDVANHIIRTELLTQGARYLGIDAVTPEEIDARLKEVGLPDEEIYRYMARVILLEEKLEEYFSLKLLEPMEQARIQVILVESEEVASEVITEIKASGNFTALVDEFSCNSSIEGDLGWLPRELMPNTLIADAAFNLAPGEISQPIYDATAIKNIGYWLIEVTDKEGDEIEARAILLGSEAEAELVRAELVGGNFSSLAKEYSQHESKNAGGELGWLKQEDMGSDAFDEVAFILAPGELSEPVKDESVQTTGGYWLVKVVDRDAERELEEGTRKKLIDKQFNEWFGAWEENSTIENRLDEEKIWWVIGQVFQRR